MHIKDIKKTKLPQKKYRHQKLLYLLLIDEDFGYIYNYAFISH